MTFTTLSTDLNTNPQWRMIATFIVYEIRIYRQGRIAGYLKPRRRNSNCIGQTNRISGRRAKTLVIIAGGQASVLIVLQVLMEYNSLNSSFLSSLFDKNVLSEISNHYQVGIRPSIFFR
jgi:hypothetical protein